MDLRGHAITVAPNNATYLNEYATNGGSLGNWQSDTDLLVGNPADKGTPVYYAQNSDGLYTLHCTAYGCPGFEGLSIHIPSVYNVEQNNAGDGHVIFVSPDKAKTYEFYQFPITLSGSPVNFTNGGCFTPATTTGWTAWGDCGGQANAGQASFMTMQITPQDLLQGSIEHALMLTIPCDGPAGSKAYPNFSANNDNVCASGHGAPVGSHLQLNMSDAAIDSALTTAGWTNPVNHMVAKALAHYGAYVMDTCGIGMSCTHWAPFRMGAGGPAQTVTDWGTVKSTLLGGSTEWLKPNWPSSIYNNFRFIDQCMSVPTGQTINGVAGCY
jgi:hypothetical protein